MASRTRSHKAARKVVRKGRLSWRRSKRSGTHTHRRKKG